MPITFRCASCNAKLTAKDSQAGQGLACPNCRTRIFVPVPEIPATTTPTPTVPAPAFTQDVDQFNEPTPAAPETVPVASPEEDSPSAYGKSRRGSRRTNQLSAGEPWYFGFLETYAKILVILFLAVELMGLLFMLISSLPFIGLLISQDAGAGWPALLAVIVAAVAMLITAAAGFLFVLVQCALVLLLVDMGRSLRAIRANTSLPPSS